MMMWLGIVQKVRVLEIEMIPRHGVWRRVGGAIVTCNKKPLTLFWYNTNFKCLIKKKKKHGTML
jgi:hypothetical protein